MESSSYLVERHPSEVIHGHAANAVLVCLVLRNRPSEVNTAGTQPTPRALQDLLRLSGYVNLDTKTGKTADSGVA